MFPIPQDFCILYPTPELRWLPACPKQFSYLAKLAGPNPGKVDGQGPGKPQTYPRRAVLATGADRPGAQQEVRTKVEEEDAEEEM